jgi:hypothetical protein
MIVFCWGMRMSFWPRPSGRDLECANKTIIFRTKYKRYFFYNRILKFLNFLIFVKFSLDAKIFVKNDILCDLITMHKCHVLLTVVLRSVTTSTSSRSSISRLSTKRLTSTLNDNDMIYFYCRIIGFKLFRKNSEPQPNLRI